MVWVALLRRLRGGEVAQYPRPQKGRQAASQSRARLDLEAIFLHSSIVAPKWANRFGRASDKTNQFRPPNSGGTMRGLKKNRARLGGLLAAAAIPATLVLAGNAEAQTAKASELVFGCTDMPPRCYLNPQGQPDGISIRLGKALLTKAGLQNRIVMYPASRLFANLQSGTVHFALLVPNPVLKECCLMSRESVGRDELRVYRIGDKPSIKRKTDLAGKSVITVRGFSYGGLLEYINDPAQRVANHVAGSHEAAFDMLVAGRADYVLDYAEAAGVTLAVNPVANLHYESLEQIQRYIYLHKTVPNAEKTMERLEAIVRTMNLDEFVRPAGK